MIPLGVAVSEAGKRHNSGKPIVCSFRALAFALQSVHRWNGPDVDRLHDVWKMGAPSPSSRVLNPVGFDERKVQAGNKVERIVFRGPLGAWIQDTAGRNGLSVTAQEALILVEAISKAWS